MFPHSLYSEHYIVHYLGNKYRGKSDTNYAPVIISVTGIGPINKPPRVRTHTYLHKETVRVLLDEPDDNENHYANNYEYSINVPQLYTSFTVHYGY